MVGIYDCPVCGCGTHWKTLGEDFGKMGVHARLLDGFDMGKVEVRQMDNAGGQSMSLPRCACEKGD